MGTILFFLRYKNFWIFLLLFGLLYINNYCFRLRLKIILFIFIYTFIKIFYFSVFWCIFAINMIEPIFRFLIEFTLFVDWFFFHNLLLMKKSRLNLVVLLGNLVGRWLIKYAEWRRWSYILFVKKFQVERLLISW